MNQKTGVDSSVSVITDNIWRLYSSAHGSRARSCFDDARIPATAIAELPAIACYQRRIEDSVKFFAARYRVLQPMLDSVYAEAKSILLFCSSATEVSSAREFLSDCAEVFLLRWTDMYGGQYERPNLPCCLGRNSALVDLASGPEFFNLFCGLTPTTTYYAVDLSFFAMECVRLKAKADGLKNVVALNRDIINLRREDIESDFIEIIRAKNVFTYVPTYLDVFQRHLSWLEDGGSYIFAEQASEKARNDVFLNNLVAHNLRSLVNEGWGFSYIFGDSCNPLALNTVSLTKSPGNSMSDNLSNLDQFYIELSKSYGGA